MRVPTGRAKARRKPSETGPPAVVPDLDSHRRIREVRPVPGMANRLEEEIDQGGAVWVA
jgi:hypothetical protein